MSGHRAHPSPQTAPTTDRDQPARLTVRTGESRMHLTVQAGMSVREALDLTELRVRAACGGTGGCGACTVRLLSGQANPPTVAEYLKLAPEARRQGLRLACQLRPAGEAEILLEDPAPPSAWKSIAAADLAEPRGGLPDLDAHVHGLAVDLGTTHIRVSLWDRRHGRRLATRRGPNPQGVFGADVLNRLDASLTGADRSREMAGLARSAIIHAVRDMLARDVGEVAPMLAEIGRMLVVGNTAMLALLTERGAGDLLAPENWHRAIDCRPADPADWRAQWPLPNADIGLVRPVAGFVGSDLLADVVATGLTEGRGGALLLDIGTNTEVALWNGRTLHVTAVPGGPAFEAVGIRHGMPAEPGAIHRVRTVDCGTRFDYQVIGGTAPRGYCGSGLVDGIAVLLRAGVLKSSGRFAYSTGREGFSLDPHDPCTAITGADVDAFQRAKAATAAAMEILLARAGMDWPEVGRLVVCGAFGRHLDVANAQSVGLLPAIDAERIEPRADAALAGCEAALLSEAGTGLFEALMPLISPVNLGSLPGFDDLFIDHLRLQPIFSGV